MNEQNIAAWLEIHPEFFERHADLLAKVRLTSPHGQRAVSLQERQMEILRDRNRKLELRLAELLRYGADNDRTQQKLQGWLLRLIALDDIGQLSAIICDGLREVFDVPALALRTWSPPLDAAPVADAALRQFADDLFQPYCGTDPGHGLRDWFADQAVPIASMAVVALRPGGAAAAGLLVLGSDKAERFHADMGTAYLQQIGDYASAALARLTACETSAASSSLR